MAQIGSIAGGHSQLLEEVGMRVLAKTQQVARQQGDAAVSLLAQAADLQKDLTSPTTGTGGSGSISSTGYATVGTVLDVTG